MQIQYHPDYAHSIASLRRDFSRHANGYPQLKSVLAVGANQDKTIPNTLSREDTLYLYSAFMHCGILALPVAETPDIRPLNIMNGPQEDFLANPQPTDILMICYVPYSVPNIRVNGPAGLRIAPEHFTPRAWETAATQSGAKLVLTFGGANEINSSNFTSKDSPFLEVPLEKIQEAYAAWKPKSTYHAPAQVLIHKDYATALHHPSR